ncbi:phosphomannomutase/phosphoglucomutase [Candidatus Dependentiae bacterium]|nr:phosphomannomutase/phosphoglucomutase [Candidatus Dependentiae bacterium]MBU4387056.1 phosphomannomutase/phosphoglucomutase [Candidatus Dependentiae bacterium]MCG2755964.1 phosphomannomutase/phosphoglucomutase [Candidatus Dependentiae bacterium]
MKNVIFREYDIRGIVGEEFEINESYLLTKAIISYLKVKQPDLKSIVVARDGRNHSPAIKDQVINAAKDMGINVLDIGICPTPVFYFSLFNTDVTSGLMITASHNPAQYNGMKICLNKKSVWGKEIQEIKNICDSQNFFENKDNKICKITYKNIIPEYIGWLAQNFEHLKNYDINAVIDCGNAAGGTVIPDLIKTMNWKNVKPIFENLDGNFPNHEADPTNIKNMQTVFNLLKTDSNLELGIGLDGDCDRMDPMTKSGYLVPGDQLLAIFSEKVLKDFPGATIVFDVKASSSLIELLKKWGAIDHICPSGHSLIKDALFKTNAKLAGELSCHFFFNDRYFGYDDGIYSILRLFEILKENNKNLDDLIKIFPNKERSAEIRISCKESEKEQIVSHVKNIFAAKKDINNITIDGLRSEGKNGWGLIRASNTQPAICLRFESNTKVGLKNVKKEFYNALVPYFNSKELKEKIEL